MARSKQGRALFYTRDSGGGHEMTPSQYVQWGINTASKLGLQFDGLPATIDEMIRDGESHRGDIFLDYGVCGNILSRPAFDELCAMAKSDATVSHILIPRRDRLARPDDAVDAVKIELSLRRQGVFLVFMDKVCEPIARGDRMKIEDALSSLIDYDRAGRDRTDLAQKIIHAQLALAKLGYSTGGRPPYGFRRWLIKTDGTKVRQLEDREYVRRPGHHVVWLPGPDAEWTIIRRILSMLKTTPASRVAKTLTAEGIPTPDSGRMRTDNGIKHFTSGAWSQTTIINIARNSLLLAICTHGRRSMGDQLRLTDHGPRPLVETDYRPDGKPKVVRNSDKSLTQARAHCRAQVEIDEHQELIAILDKRGETQRGKPRSRNPNKNPLGGRIFDMDCGWPMYRVPRGEKFEYTCASYMQSGECAHNQIDGPAATEFLLSCIRQRLIARGMTDKLRSRLRQLATADASESSKPPDKTHVAELKRVQSDLQRVKRNLAYAEDKDQYEAISTVFDELLQQEAKLKRQIESVSANRSRSSDVDQEINAALALFDQLPELASNAEALPKITELFGVVNARLFLQFQKVRLKKRTVNRLSHGVVTFGVAAAPIELYVGPTGRRALQRSKAAMVAAGPEGKESRPDQLSSSREKKSLGNVSRGERI